MWLTNSNYTELDTHTLEADTQDQRFHTPLQCFIMICNSTVFQDYNFRKLIKKWTSDNNSYMVASVDISQH